MPQFPTRLALVPLLLALAPAPASAELAPGITSGFEVRLVRELHTTPATAYRVAVHDVGRWWNPAHTYSGVAANLSLQDRPGGCFCERLAGGGVQHLQVVYVERGKQLRLLGGLGPLQELAAQGAMTWRFERAGDGTRMTWTYRVAGLEPAAAASLARVVESVVTEQADRLTRRLEGTAR